MPRGTAKKKKTRNEEGVFGGESASTGTCPSCPAFPVTLPQVPDPFGRKNGDDYLVTVCVQGQGVLLKDTVSRSQGSPFLQSSGVESLPEWLS